MSETTPAPPTPPPPRPRADLHRPLSLIFDLKNHGHREIVGNVARGMVHLGQMNVALAIWEQLDRTKDGLPPDPNATLEMEPEDTHRFEKAWGVFVAGPLEAASEDWDPYGPLAPTSEELKGWADGTIQPTWELGDGS